MNLRKITLRYMGWCPGIEAAARFVPNKEINIPYSMRLFTATMAIFLCFTLVAYAFYPPIPEGPLQITIHHHTGKQVIFDHEFNESYDYRLLFGDKFHMPLVIFREKLDPSEFASGTEVEVENLTFETLEEVYHYVREEVGAPNVVACLARYLLNQTFEETYFKIWSKQVYVSCTGFEVSIGDKNLLGRSEGLHYLIRAVRNTRASDFWYDLRDYDNTIDEGLRITKINTQSHGIYNHELIWELHIDASKIFYEAENPCYEVMFIRYPRGVREP